MTYTLVVTNTGPSTATSVTLTDVLPAEFTYQSASSDQGSCSPAGQIVTCILGNLPFDSVATATIVVETPKASGTYTNTATVAANEVELNPDDNTASEETAVAYHALYLPALRKNQGG